MNVPPLSAPSSTLNPGFSFSTQQSMELLITVDPVYPTFGLSVTGLAMVFCIMKFPTKVTNQREATTETSDCDI
jgi:hypothetical protein